LTDPWLGTLETRFLLAPIGYTPAQIVHAYGYDKVSFDVAGVAVPGDGRGETVALFEVGVTPGLAQDLAVFDRAFDLPDLTSWTSGNVPPSTSFLRTIGFDGGDSAPADPGDQGEALLDVEWLHAVAPAANILVIEAADALELPEGVRSQKGVTANVMLVRISERAEANQLG
jgi:subtilase family serine protease